MITAAALCPWPPLLVRELTGADPVLPELRQACAAAVSALLRDEPEVVAVVGPGPETARWPGHGQLRIAAFGGQQAEAGEAARPALPASAGLGAYLLDQAGYRGPRVIWTVSQDEPTAGCCRLGAGLAALSQRAVLLVMGDGSARRGPKAPGHFDERSAAFDAGVERAVRAGDLGALLAIDPALARELMATGRPAWQVLAGALGALPRGGQALAVDVRYAGDPFGVMYLVASLAPVLLDCRLAGTDGQ
ncbi:MAG TPA: hypothetical protein VMV92_13385 [Streptosporangiaceae bacterium]|nr:hypothetical protein [Streptosporangiaceae bacterium]